MARCRTRDCRLVAQSVRGTGRVALFWITSGAVMVVVKTRAFVCATSVHRKASTATMMAGAKLNLGNFMAGKMAIAPGSVNACIFRSLELTKLKGGG